MVGDFAVVPIQTFLRGSHVRRRDHQRDIDAGGGRASCLRDRAPCRGQSAAGQQRHATTRAFDRGLEQRDILVLVERGGFAGRARDHQRARSADNLVVDEARECVEVDRVAAREERCRECADAA